MDDESVEPSTVDDGQASEPKPDLLPLSFGVAKQVQGTFFGRPLTLLLDSGSTTTWCNKKCLPKGVQGYSVDKVTGSTLAGTFSSSEQVCLEDFSLPDFHPKRTLPKLKARVFHADCRYDMIIGRDVLRAFGIRLDFEDNCIACDGVSVPMREFPNDPDIPPIEHLLQDYLDRIENDGDSSPDDNFASEILDSSYEPADIRKIADSCTHLTPEQRDDLYKLLSKFDVLFNNKLKTFTDEKIHLDIDETVPPHRSRAYAVPHVHKRTFKTELERLVEEDVLEKCGRATWVAGTFIIPKKDGRVRWVSDFRALNKALKRKYYPLPKISEILSRRKGYKYLSKLDLSMQYYTFELDEESKDLCTIATPWGLFRYKRLPMGVSPAPDIAQEIMERVLAPLIEEIEVYLDDIAAFSDDWPSHLTILEKVLTILQEKGFSVNPAKCEWGIQETDFLGHWLTPEGVKPWRKKIDAILRMEPPTNIKELRSFLGMVTYYRDMWPRRAHVLAPLTALIKSKDFRWGPDQQRAFTEMKALMATDALLVYPDHNKGFDIETDASDYQLGAVIKQCGRPVAYYSRKLSSAQKNYTTIEKELLSVVETLRTFRSMLLGAKITVHSDHKNLTHKLSQFTTQRVMRWRLLLEEYGPTFVYKKGSENCIADALSRVPTKDENVTPAMPETRCVKVDDLWTECLWAMPKFDEQNRHPFQFETIAHYQSTDNDLMNLPTTNPGEFTFQKFGSHDLVCRIVAGNQHRIALTGAMLPRIVTWYHLLTAHAEGMVRLEASLRRHFWHPRLREEIRQQLSTCQTCMEMKKNAPKYGLLAPRDVPGIPWSEAHVDLIGPWEFKNNGLKMSLRAMTIIDPVTNLVEIVRVTSTKSAENTRVFKNTWLARYPRPERVVTDNGPEFTGHEWEFLLMDWGIKKGRISSHTPTANAIVESSHRVIGQILRTVLHGTNVKTKAELEAAADDACAIATRVMRCVSNTSLQGMAPGALVFGRDMNVNIPFITDIVAISANRQLQTDVRLHRENTKRIRHDYAVGERVYVNNHHSTSDKLKPAWVGPFPILRVHTNGTVTVQRGQVHERISLRRIKPEQA